MRSLWRCRGISMEPCSGAREARGTEFFHIQYVFSRKTCCSIYTTDFEAWEPRGLGPSGACCVWGLLLALGPGVVFAEGAQVVWSPGMAWHWPLRGGILVDEDHGAGRQGPQGGRGERCRGAEEERVPGRAGKAARAAWQDSVQPWLPDGERQQVVPGWKGKACFVSCLVLFLIPIYMLLNSSQWEDEHLCVDLRKYVQLTSWLGICPLFPRWAWCKAFFSGDKWEKCKRTVPASDAASCGLFFLFPTCMY